jgi:hypothetical protein
MTLAHINEHAVVSYDALCRPKHYLKHTQFIHGVKKLIPNINDYFTDGEMIEDMYKLNWTPNDVLTYWETIWHG